MYRCKCSDHYDINVYGTELVNNYEFSCNSILKESDDVNKFFHEAIKQGRVDLVQKALLGMDEKNIESYIDVFSLVHDCVHREMICIIIVLAPFIKEKIGNSNLMFSALGTGNIELIENLFLVGGDVNAKDRKGRTLLHFVVNLKKLKNKLPRYLRKDELFVSNYSISLIRLLMNYGADLNSINIAYHTPIHVAVRTENEVALSVLLEYKVNAKEVVDGALHVAVLRQNANLTRMLLNAGYSLEVTDTSCNTPLHTAVNNRNTEVTNVLLDHEAMTVDCINSVNRMGLSALHIAVVRSCVDIVKKLIAKGAGLNMQTPNGDTALMLTLPFYAIYEPPSFNLDVFEIKSRFHYCLTCDLVKILIAANADVNIKNKMGYTVFHIAVLRNKLCMMKNLLQGNYKKSLLSSMLFYSMQYHSRLGHFSAKLMRLLLEHGAYVDFRNSDKSTPLHVAISIPKDFINHNIRLECIRVLIDYNADVNAKTLDGLTPLQLASVLPQYTSNHHVINILLESGANMFIDGNLCVTHDSWEHFLESISMNMNPSIKKGVYWYAVMEISAELYEDREKVPGVLIEKLAESTNVKDFDIKLKFIKQFYWRCLDEVELMKSTLINSVSYYELLAADAKLLDSYLLDDNIAESLNSGRYRDRFPIYSSLIEAKLRRALRRKEVSELVNSGRIFLAYIAHIHGFRQGLLNDCFEIIIKYLHLYDLRNVRSVVTNNSEFIKFVCS